MRDGVGFNRVRSVERPHDNLLFFPEHFRDALQIRKDRFSLEVPCCSFFNSTLPKTVKYVIQRD